MAVSNMPAIWPLRTAWQAGDMLLFSSTAFVSLFSALSHLAENHKHGMPGIGLSRTISRALNRCDVLGCFIAGAAYGLRLYQASLVISENATLLAFCLLPFPLNLISESDHSPATRRRYMITHMAWHMSIFTAMGVIMPYITRPT